MERRLTTIPLGPLQSNMYIISGDSGLFVVDPSVSPDEAEKHCNLPGLSMGELPVKAILITHGHHDHIKYVDEWIDSYPFASVFFSSNDKALLTNGYMNCSYMEGSETCYDFEFVDLAGRYGQVIFREDNVEVKVFETPGHTAGSVCFLVNCGGEEMLFTGDTVFRESVGRTDMPGGSSKDLIDSVRRLSKLDPELRIYPGHGSDSTIGYERKFNYFFSK